MSRSRRHQRAMYRAGVTHRPRQRRSQTADIVGPPPPPLAELDLLPQSIDDSDGWTVFADYLLETGQSHRAQLIIEELSNTTPKTIPHREIIGAALAGWLERDDADQYLTVRWQYGYIIEADIKTPKALPALLASPAIWLLDSLTLRTPSGSAPEKLHAAQLPFLRHLRAVCRGPYPLNLAAARAVLSGDGLSKLDTLTITGVRFDTVLKAAISGPILEGLRELSLEGGPFEQSTADWLLGQAIRFRHLERLDLRRHQGPFKQSPHLQDALPNLLCDQY